MTLRGRLTFGVTVVFAVTLTFAALVASRLVESALRADVRQNAEAILTDYVVRLESGALRPGDPNDAATRFVYLSSDGVELSEADYQAILVSALEDALGDFPPPVAALPLPDPGLGSGPVLLEQGWLESAPLGPVVEAVAGPRLLESGDDVVVMGVPVTIGDEQLTVAVSAPLITVDDTMDSLRRLRMVALPLLTGAISIATWMVTGRMTAPVAAMTRQAGRISASNLDERVPEPDGKDEIAQLASTMNDMLDRLEAARSGQQQFVADASHELRSPIAATIASIETIGDSPEPIEWQRHRVAMLREQRRLADLVDDLLLLTQVEEREAHLRRADVDLDELAIAEGNRLHRRTVSVKITSPARVHGNARLLEHAIRNLVENAVRHAETAVLVSVDLGDGVATVTVDDDGPGVPEVDRRRIFRRFARLDDARSRADGGAGLGLAIVDRVAAFHGGTVTCAESPRGGARFVFAMPVASATQ